MKKLTEKQKLIALGIFIFVLLSVGIMLYILGKRKGAIKINVSNPIIDDPDDADNQGKQMTEVGILQLAQDCYQDMDGMNFSHNADVWSQVLALSDTDFVRLNNKFNLKYQAESEESFRSWVENETDISAFGFSWPAIKDSLLKRFAKLNLS